MIFTIILKTTTLGYIKKKNWYHVCIQLVSLKQPNMKKTILFGALAATLLFFASCKKDDPTPPADLSNTTWNGSTTIAAIPVTQSYVFNANGTLSGSTTSTGGTFALAGTWSKTPNSSVVYMYFTIATVPGNYSAQGTLDGTGTKIESGAATNSSDASYNYTFSLTKM